MEPKQTADAFALEIAELEARLQQKKLQMESAGIVAPEKHVFKEVIKEHSFAKENTGDNATVVANTAQPQTAITQSTRTATPEEELVISKHIATAFVKGIASAVSDARKTDDPFLIDLLHDRLADEYYQKLLAARKIKAV